MKKIISSFVLCTFASAPAFAENFYGAVRIQSADQKLTSADLTSPRVDDRIKSPSRDSGVTGSVALGYAFQDGWRLEGEFTTRKNSNFDSYWTPFDANVNRMEVSSQRLMVNGFKDFAITEKVSVYGMLGLGVAHISSEGYQTNPGRRFANNSQNNFAYSLGLGADYKLTEKVTVGGGYRYVNMGKIETGQNTFVNRVNARDEQLKGRLSEQNVFLEVRVAL